MHCSFCVKNIFTGFLCAFLRFANVFNQTQYSVYHTCAYIILIIILNTVLLSVQTHTHTFSFDPASCPCVYTVHVQTSAFIFWSWSHDLVYIQKYFSVQHIIKHTITWPIKIFFLNKKCNEVYTICRLRFCTWSTRMPRKWNYF